MEERKPVQSLDDVVTVLSEKFGTLEGAVTTLSGKVGDFPKKLGALEDSVRILAKKVDHVELSLNESVDILALQIHGVNKRLDGIDGRLDGIDGRLDGHDTCFDLLEEGLDRRFANLHGDMMQVIGMENDKLLTVVDVLHEKGTMTAPERRTIRLIKPFPKR